MVKAILVYDDDFSPMATTIVGSSREKITDYVEKEAEKHSNEQSYIIREDDEYKFEVVYTDKMDDYIIITVHFNITNTLMVG